MPNDRADDVRSAFCERLAGATITALSARLGMTPSGTRKLLANRTYLGELRDGPYINADAHPALVLPSLFADVAGVGVFAERDKRCTALLSGACHSRNRCPQHVAVARSLPQAAQEELRRRASPSAIA